ncbi:MAG: cytochrome C oxidase assembly protein [Roseobacter sp.]|jgi:hypothetical protein|nr:cytochrome C oxidase assembly protein [Roseobacter sp.]
MTIRAEHEIHNRRKGRNIGVGLMLAGFVVLVLAITFVKVTGDDFQMPDMTSTTVEG